MKKCLCCGYRTIKERGIFEICPICFWEDDTYFDFSKTPLKGIYYDSEPTMEELLDVKSAANHGLTLREAQINYKTFGACDKEMIPYTRKATIDEIQDKE